MAQLNIHTPIPSVDSARLLPHLRSRTVAKPTRCTSCRKQSATTLCLACQQTEERAA